MSETVLDSITPSGRARGRAEEGLAGTTLANRYDVLELVGVGGMGAVYRVRDRELDEMVALKVIRKELAALPSMIDRFRHEVKLARRVTHANVARTFELGSADGLIYCTMELIEGESLTSRLQRGKAPVIEAVSIVSAICEGLAVAHAASVIHRDIKPDNILLARDGRVVLADFGVAAAGTAAGELSGTPAYMAPEQARGAAPRPTTDVYAIAVVLAEMLTGVCPFSGDTATILDAKQKLDHVTVKDAPSELAAVIAQATARDVDVRIQTAEALRRALEPWARPTTRMFAAQPKATAGELTTVIVVAPVGSSPKLYLAEAVHEQLLARLGRTPRLRVLPRPNDAPTPGNLHVAFTAGDALDVTVTLAQGTRLSLQFPLAIDHVEVTAEAIAAAIEGDMARAAAADPIRDAALELVLRARHGAQRDLTRMSSILDWLREAREIAPTEPRVLAINAIAYVRSAFFQPDFMADALERGRELAYAAVVADPSLADAHIAVGHVELGRGNGVLAATHFRKAVHCAPYLAEAHEQLGRILLEAGYLSDAIKRLEDAIAINPDLRSARWEIARGYALEARWDDCERVIADLVRNADRPIARARYAWWRGNLDVVRELRASTAGALERALHPGLIQKLFDIFIEPDGWSRHRDELLRMAHLPHANRRRVTFILQLAAEAAAFAREDDTVFELIGLAADQGLFDLHWLERCPLLQPFVGDPRYAPIHAQIKQRADAIHDALRGDNVALSATQIA